MSASVSVSEMSHLVVRPPRCSSSPFFFPHLPCDAPSSPYSFRAHPYFCETCYCRHIEATSTFHLSIDPRSQSHLPGFVTRLALACSSCLVLRNITPSLFSTLIFGLFHQTSFLSFPCVPTFFFFPLSRSLLEQFATVVLAHLAVAHRLRTPYLSRRKPNSKRDVRLSADEPLGINS